MRKIRAYHFVNAEWTLLHDAETLTVEPGYVYSIGKAETPRLCNCGMHGSIRAIDALQYAPGPIVCLVDIWGDIEHGDDKLCGRHREVIAAADATRVLHQFACWCVRHTPLGGGKTVWDLLTDERSRRAVEVKEMWLLGKATDKELDAACAAAHRVSWVTSRKAARLAAWASARAAAHTAAQTVTLADAWPGIRGTVQAAQDQQLTLMLSEVLL